MADRHEEERGPCRDIFFGLGDLCANGLASDCVYLFSWVDMFGGPLVQYIHTRTQACFSKAFQGTSPSRTGQCYSCMLWKYGGKVAKSP